MELVLPAEMWNEIFSYLSLQDLSRARMVCRTWWDLVNQDHLWKAQALKQKITDNLVKIETNDGNPLETCRWAKVCTGYAKVASNWEKPTYKVKECPLSTECVLIRLPYLLSTFYSHWFVDVQRLVDGDFVPWSKLQLPEDGQDGPFVPQMTCDSVLVVSKNAYSIIFRLVGEKFIFETAVCLTRSGDVEDCSVEADLTTFLKTKPHLNAFFTCCSANEETIWLFEDIAKHIYVWNFAKRCLVRSITANTLTQTLSNDRFFFCTVPESIVVYSLSGNQLSVYTHQQAHISGVNEDDFGCCFIQTTVSTRKALYLNAYTGKLVEFFVERPLAASVKKSDRLAYCISYYLGVASLNCLSVETGDRLWETSVSPSRPVNTSSWWDHVLTVAEIRFIRGKYILVHGVDTQAPEFISPLMLTLFTIEKSPLSWSRPFTTAKIVHLSDHFIVTRERLPRGGMRYKFEIHSFL